MSNYIYNPYNDDDEYKIKQKIYYPYPANNNKNKYYIITKSGKKIYFGQYEADDFTTHKDPDRKMRYINRHKKNEEHLWNKSGIDSPSFWSRFFLWEYPTKKEAYDKIKRDLKKWKAI